MRIAFLPSKICKDYNKCFNVMCFFSNKFYPLFKEAIAARNQSAFMILLQPNKFMNMFLSQPNLFNFYL